MDTAVLQRSERGARAEDAALAYLQARGMHLLMRNYRCRSGEIDLVLLDGATVVFVEVRSREHHRYGTPAESVGARKQRKFLTAVQHFLLTHKQYARSAQRIDVVAVTTAQQPPRIDWIANAFSTSY